MTEYGYGDYKYDSTIYLLCSHLEGHRAARAVLNRLRPERLFTRTDKYIITILQGLPEIFPIRGKEGSCTIKVAKGFCC